MTGHEIKLIRRRHHLSQEALARLIGVSFTTVNRWENGHGSPRGLLLAAFRALKEAKRLPENGRMVAHIVGDGHVGR